MTAPPLDQVQLHLVENTDDAFELMRWLGDSRRALAVDTETGGFEFWKQPLRLVQFGDLTQAWAVPWQDWSGLVKDVFRRYDRPLVMHNAKFDWRFLTVNGCSVDWARVEDTQAMAHILDSSALKGLKPCGVRHVDQRVASMQSDLRRAFTKNKWTWATVPVDYPDYWIYAAVDTTITARLLELFEPKVRARYHEVYELEMASQKVISDIEQRGARIDVAYCERAYEELTDYVEQMGNYIQKTYRCGVSDTAVAARLLAEGVHLTKRTATGKWALDKEVLEAIDHPLAKDCLSRRQAQKMASAYFRNLLRRRDGDILRPDIDPLGADTSRMSISSPALQQVPRGRKVRDALIAREGGKLVDVDFDQEEQRLIAHFSQDPFMIEAFREADSGGVDFFTSAARRVYDDPAIEREDVRRGSCKTASYAKAYGGGGAAIAHGVRMTYGLDWTPEQGEQFSSDYDRAFPKYYAWTKDVEREAREEMATRGKPGVRTPWGRCLVGDEDKIYAMVNYKIQGTAADVLKQKLVDLDQAGLARYAVLPVHDELLFDVPEDEVEEVSGAIVEVMRETERFRVPLTCAAAVGDTWGEVH